MTKKKAAKKAAKKASAKTGAKGQGSDVFHPKGYRTVWVPETQSYRHVPTM